MRRKDRQLSEAETMALLEQGEYGVLGTVSADGQPYGVPLNYCCLDGAIFFHCALQGRKLNNIETEPRVCFCVVGRTRLEPAAFSTKYESCLVEGVASEAFGEEKRAALAGLIRKYAPDHITEGNDYIERKSAGTTIIKITINAITGKAKR